MENLTENDFWNMQNAINQCLTTGESKFTAEDGREFIVDNEYVKSIKKARENFIKQTKKELKRLEKSKDDEIVGISVKTLKILMNSAIDYYEMFN